MNAATAPTVVVAFHDGFYGHGTGAGRCNRALLDSLVGSLAPGVRLVVLPIYLRPDSPEYDAGWHAATQAVVTKVGGHVVPFDNGTGGMRRFAGLDGFRRASASAADIISRLMPEARPMLIVASDVPFYGLAPLLSERVRAHTVAIAHSTAVLHDPDDHARIAWEQHGLREMVAYGGHVAAISTHMRRHLVTEYDLPANTIVDLIDGLTSDEWRIPAPQTRLLPAAAAGGFLLGYGRAEPYKGWDDLLDAISLAGPLPHTVLAAVTEGRELSPYQCHLARRIADERLNVTLLPRFHPGVRSLLAHPGLAALVVPSRVEPFGRIPLEAFVAGAAPVVATTAGGLAHLVLHEQTGYSAAPEDPRSLAAAIRRAVDADPRERARLRQAGRQLVATRHDYERNIRGFLHRLAPWALALGGR
ncbi:glycosyltransferase family 4 protein [Nonomuraea sp. M3C6]|uniref:Glycosyltransferase family 4 protein n=1 Tax=Nonomuraea marmarensis TaxID=3351344 RepID=A0ABW7AJE0_9ACTN